MWNTRQQGKAPNIPFIAPLPPPPLFFFYLCQATYNKISL